MAGIGFELRRMSARSGLAAPLSTAFHGASVVAGPWLLTVAAMAVLQKLLGADRPEAFTLQSIIIYMFCISLIATAPVIAAAQRLVAEHLYAGRFDGVRSIYLLTALLCALAGASASAAVFGVLFRFPLQDVLISLLAVGTASTVWPAVSFAATVKTVKTITFGFFCGLVVAIAATLAVVRCGAGPALQAFAFATGLGLAAAFISTAVLRTFALPATELRAALRSIAGMAVRRRAAIIGATLAVLAIWIDSIIVWASPYATRTPLGLVTTPRYDSALFIARLTMLPGLIVYLVAIDTSWFTAIRRFLTAIEGHSTLLRIEEQAARLRALTNASMLRLIVVQGSAGILFLFLAPVYVPLSGLAYLQMSTLRFGLMGAFFHVLFFVASTLVLNCGREASFMRLQLMFLTLNAGGDRGYPGAAGDVSGHGLLRRGDAERRRRDVRAGPFAAAAGAGHVRSRAGGLRDASLRGRSAHPRRVARRRPQADNQDRVVPRRLPWKEGTSHDVPANEIPPRFASRRRPAAHLRARARHARCLFRRDFGRNRRRGQVHGFAPADGARRLFRRRQAQDQLLRPARSSERLRRCRFGSREDVLPAPRSHRRLRRRPGWDRRYSAPRAHRLRRPQER